MPLPNPGYFAWDIYKRLNKSVKSHWIDPLIQGIMEENGKEIYKAKQIYSSHIILMDVSIITGPVVKGLMEDNSKMLIPYHLDGCLHNYSTCC